MRNFKEYEKGPTLNSDIRNFIKANKFDFTRSEIAKGISDIFGLAPADAEEAYRDLKENNKNKVNNLIKEASLALKEGLSDEVEALMIKDPAAQGFNRVHGQILNGGFSQLYDNSRGDVSDIIKKAKVFTMVFAPDFSKAYGELLNKYTVALSKYGTPYKRDANGNTVENMRVLNAWAEIDDEYYDFYEDMENAIEKAYRAKFVN